MKKFLIILFVIFSNLCMYAEKGDFTIGLHLYDNPKLQDGNAFGGGASLRYDFTDNLRAKLQASTFSVDESFCADCSLEVQWAWFFGEKFALYPAIGVGYMSYCETPVTFLVGPGFEYNFDEHWKLNLDFRAQYANGGVGLPITFGVGYTF